MDSLINPGLQQSANQYAQSFLNLTPAMQQVSPALSQFYQPYLQGFANFFQQMAPQVQAEMNLAYGQPFGGDVGHRLDYLAKTLSAREAPWNQAFLQAWEGLSPLADFLYKSYQSQHTGAEKGAGYEVPPSMSAFDILPKIPQEKSASSRTGGGKGGTGNGDGGSASEKSNLPWETGGGYLDPWEPYWNPQGGSTDVFSAANYGSTPTGMAPGSYFSPNASAYGSSKNAGVQDEISGPDSLSTPEQGAPGQGALGQTDFSNLLEAYL